jgi:hypothetical protein
MTNHFMFHILWISIIRFLYFNFFSASFCITFLSDLIIIIIMIIIIIGYLVVDAAHENKNWTELN